jgi:putative membrane protein
MNMNKKIVTSVIIGTLGVSTIFGASKIPAMGSSYRNVLSSESYNQIVNEVATTDATVTRNGEGIEKEETVYAKANATGQVNQVIVSDWIKNFSGDATITDKTTLSDIVNVKGDETFTQGENGEIVWQANGNDIYYQGTTDAELPITIKATYKLDGVEIQPDDLKGKSGQLTIEYNYENNAKVDGSDMYTPFTVVAATMLKTDNFANVTAENAKIISDGDKYAVVGVAMPGLKDSLDLGDDTKVPGSITITADVTDYEPITVLNVVTADLLNEIKLDDTDQLKDLADSMDELADASKKLVDGSSDLSDGLNELKDKTGEYTDGVTTLTSSLDEYIAGVSKVTSGIKTLYNGSGELTKGVSSLATGAKSLNSGLKQASTGVDSLVTNFDALVKGAGSIKSGADSLNTALKQLEAGKQAENEAYATLAQTVENNEKIIAALKSAGVDESIVGMLEKNTAGQKQIAQGLAKSGAQIEAGLSQAATGASTLATGSTTLSSGLTKMKKGAKSLQSAMGQLTSGSKSLLDGANKLNAASGTLSSGIKQLYDGSVALDAASAKIKSATPKLNDASSKLLDGVKTAADGGKTLKDGMKEFDQEGISKLIDAVDGKLGDVIDKFDDLQDAASKYTTFTDTNSEFKSSVKFIIELSE